jgi:hypothetical protein
MEDDKPRSFLGFTKAEASAALIVYVVFFLRFRFDIRRSMFPFQHPMATGKAALFAVPCAVIAAVLVKIRSQNPARENSHFTSLSLNDSQSKKPQASDNEMRS